MIKLKDILELTEERIEVWQNGECIATGEAVDNIEDVEVESLTITAYNGYTYLKITLKENKKK